MRANRLSGSEGGGAFNPLSLPLSLRTRPELRLMQPWQTGALCELLGGSADILVGLFPGCPGAATRTCRQECRHSPQWFMPSGRMDSVQLRLVSAVDLRKMDLCRF